MKTLIYIVLAWSTLLSSLPAFAKNNAVTLTFVSKGNEPDLATIGATRKLIASAIADGSLDTFINTRHSSPNTPAKNTGFSACIEASSSATPQTFEAFVKRLQELQPKPGNTLSVVSAANCTKAPEVITCGGVSVKLCPDNKICIDDPHDTCDPLQGGIDCPGTCYEE